MSVVCFSKYIDIGNGMHRQTLLSLSTYPSFSKSGCLFYFSSHAFKIIHLQSLGFRKIYSTMLVFNKYDLRIIFCTHFNKRKIFHYHTFSHHFSSRPLNNPHTLILHISLSKLRSKHHFYNSNMVICVYIFCISTLEFIRISNWFWNTKFVNIKL